MAVLTDEKRFEVWQYFMQTVPRGESTQITKADIRAAVDALDTWLNDNAAAANAALPQPARSLLSTQEKARLMQQVISQRYLSGV